MVQSDNEEVESNSSENQIELNPDSKIKILFISKSSSDLSNFFFNPITFSLFSLNLFLISFNSKLYELLIGVRFFKKLETFPTNSNIF